MKRKEHILTIDHCKEAMTRPILIGSDSVESKQFMFNIWENEYQVIHAGTIIDSGQAVEELLDVYNNL